MSIVTSSCILASSKDIKLNKNFFLRDTIFLLLGQITLLYATLVRGNIDMTTSISFVGMYLIYVIVVFLQEKYWYDEDANAQLVMVEMKKLTSAVSEESQAKS